MALVALLRLPVVPHNAPAVANDLPAQHWRGHGNKTHCRANQRQDQKGTNRKLETRKMRPTLPGMRLP